LPLVNESARVASAASSLVAASSSDALLAGVCVLVIDDEADMRSALSLLLEQMGARVVALDSGRGVEGALEAHRPDVLVLDISMPAEDGYALIRRVRKLPASAGGNVPAISLTAHARTEDRARAFSAGFQRHLSKPIDVPSLVTAIQELCLEPRARAAEA
jgi:CheY-like chemotaxis protein